MLKLEQQVFLPCHEVLGRVIALNDKRAIIRVTGERNFDVEVTPQGLLPNTRDTSLVEKLRFTHNENACIMQNGCIKLVKVMDITIKNCNVAYVIKNNNEEISTVGEDELTKLVSLKRMVDKRFKENEKIFGFFKNAPEPTASWCAEDSETKED